MNPGWRVVDCTGLEGSLCYRRGQLVVRTESPSSETVIALSQVAIVLVGARCSISGAVLQKFSDYDIAMLVCDWRNIPVAAASPWGEHSRVGARQRAQADLSLPRKKQAWAQIVRSKVIGQATELSKHSAPISKELRLLASSIKSGDPDNIEAQAARKYWAAISGSQTFARCPGEGEAGWNAALDYGYTLLRGHGIRAVTSAGLAPALGVFHRGRSNAFNLVDDLIEPFRPMIDGAVFDNIEPDSPLGPEQKSCVSSALDGAFSEDGKSAPTVFEDFAQQYGLYVEGNSTTLTVPKWRGSNYASEG